MSTTETPSSIAADLEGQAAALEADSAPLAAAQAAALREAAGLLREAEERAARWARHPRARGMRQAMGLYEACLFAMGCDDTRETEEDVQEAARRGFVRPNSLTGELELSPDGEALVDAVGEAKARAAQEGPVVWPGAAVDVVLGWPARPAPGPGDGLDITIPGGAARPAMTVGLGVALGLYRAAIARGGGFASLPATRDSWVSVYRSAELEVFLDTQERVVLECPGSGAVVVPDAVWCAREEAQ